MKRPGQYGRVDQRETAERLRGRGYCVVECQTLQEGLDAILGYLELHDPRPTDPTDVQLWRAELERAALPFTPRRR